MACTLSTLLSEAAANGFRGLESKEVKVATLQLLYQYINSGSTTASTNNLLMEAASRGFVCLQDRSLRKSVIQLLMSATGSSATAQSLITSGMATGFSKLESRTLDIAILQLLCDLGAVPPIVFPFGGVVITHTNGTMTQYAASADTDIARGDALWAAVQAVQANEDMDLSNGVFNIGDNSARQINLARTGGSWRIHGNGKLVTTIQATAGNNNLITFAASSQTTDITLLCSDPNSIMGGWGVYDVFNVAPPDYLNVWLYNVSIVGQSDAILMGFMDTHRAHVEMNVVNTTMSTKWDCHHISGVDSTSVMNWYNCHATAIADEEQPGAIGDARCFVFGLVGTYNLYGCTAYASDLPDTGSEISAGLILVGDGSGTRANIYGGSYKAVRDQNQNQPRPGKEVSLLQSSLVSNARIYATPSVVWDTFLDTIVPNQVPSALAEISWTAPALPARPYPKPVI